MDEILDSLWFKTEVLIHHIKTLLDVAFAPLNDLGPTVAVAAIALVTVIITKLLSRAYKTPRHKELEKQFFHWFQVRQEALKSEDPEKGRLLAKNIDQAKLNKVYYDYFFEGLLNSLVTRYLPILIFLAYVNEAYQPGNLLQLCGRDYILKLNDLSGGTIVIGAGFWFVASLFLIYLGWSTVRWICSKNITTKKPKPVAEIQEQPNVIASP